MMIFLVPPGLSFIHMWIIALVVSCRQFIVSRYQNIANRLLVHAFNSKLKLPI